MRSPLRPRPRSFLVAFALLLALVLDDGGGAATGTPTATEPASPSPTATQTATPSRTALPTSTATPEPENPEPSTVVPTWIDGLVTVEASGHDEDWRVDVEFPAALGRSDLEFFNEGLEAKLPNVEDLTDVEPDGLRRGRSIQVDFLVASGDVTEVQLREIAAAASSTVLYTTVWFDLRTHELLHAVDLLDGDTALASVAALTRLAVYATGIEADPQEVARGTSPSPEHFDTLGFDDQGRLMVTFDRYQIGHRFFPVRSIALDRKVVEPLLSDFGRRVLAETVDPSEVLDTGAHRNADGPHRGLTTLTVAPSERIDDHRSLECA